MIIVSDTTPLNYLILIDQAHILHELYDSVLIPQSVFDEMQRAETTPHFGRVVCAYSSSLRHDMKLMWVIYVTFYVQKF